MSTRIRSNYCTCRADLVRIEACYVLGCHTGAVQCTTCYRRPEAMIGIVMTNEMIEAFNRTVENYSAATSAGSAPADMPSRSTGAGSVRSEPGMSSDQSTNPR